jgi:isocitrate dehydrogenase (NAD+)
VSSKYDAVDLVVLRENTEGLYAGIEHEVTPGTVVSLKVSTRAAAERIAGGRSSTRGTRAAARSPWCHKKAVLPKGDGAFVDAFFEVGRDYPFVEQEEQSLDQVAMSLVEDPSRFDVLLLENLYGDILSDLCAGLVGGLGVVPGANVGDKVAVFEAVHGTAPDIAGQGLANPLAVLLSACLMLDWMGQAKIARRIRESVEDVLAAGKVRTRDLGGTAGTAEFTAAVVDGLEVRR